MNQIEGTLQNAKLTKQTLHKKFMPTQRNHRAIKENQTFENCKCKI